MEAYLYVRLTSDAGAKVAPSNTSNTSSAARRAISALCAREPTRKWLTELKPAQQMVNVHLTLLRGLEHVYKP
ncbi:unnamed protein product [Arctogadus glacialis]